jgi:hypothetical protein
MPFPLPSWLDVTPNFYSAAMEAGARAGLAVSEQQQRAQELAAARAERAAQMEERQAQEAERQREFDTSHLLNVQKVAQDAAQLQQQVAHQTAQEQNQAAQESRLLNYQQGVLGYDQGRLALEKQKLAQGTPLAGERYLKLSEDEATLAEQSRLAGDVGGYQQHTEKSQLWRSAIPSHQSSLTVGMDEAGRPLVTQTSGVQPSINPLGKPTTAMNTKSQENTVKYENALTLINQLQKGLTPRDVGAAGLLGEMVMDRTLAQFDPSFADKDRIEKRTALGALRESLLRTVSDDPRFSNVDRDEISKLLPSTGAFESYPDAIGRMGQVKKILGDRIERYAGASGVAVPASAKSREGVIADYTNSVQQLTDAVRAKRLTPEQAHDRALKLHKAMEDALERFH